MLLLLIYLSCLFASTRSNQQCSNDSPPKVPKYHLLEKCYRSKLGIASQANLTSLASCQRLGIEKKALAINFSPPEAVRMMKKKRKQGLWRNLSIEYTCEVLKCSEAYGGLSLVNDTRFDYYSIYAKPLPTGMFHVYTKRQNYSEADSLCRNMSSVLADILSEERTDALAQVLAGASVDAAYVGLSRVNGSSFYSVNGDSLDCTTYRAWAPGHPRKPQTKYNCILLSRNKTWRTSDCKKKHPFLCELMPNGPPYKRSSIFNSLDENGTTTTGPNDFKTV